MDSIISNIEDAKILIVDDSPEIIDILHHILPINIKRQVALNGSYALKLLNNIQDIPDLILLDILMPDMDGFDVCKKIKESNRLKDIPIIFISSSNETFDKVQAFKAGAVDYITKPFQKEEVKARVYTHLEILRSKKIIHNLYAETIQGIIGAMNDMLAIANPQVARISNAMRMYSVMIMKELSIKDGWDLSLACLLSGLGLLSANITKESGCSLSISDNPDVNIDYEIKKAYSSLTLSRDIVDRIPKFDIVTNILGKSMSPLEKSYINMPPKDMPSEVLKGHILRLLIHYLYKFESGKNHIQILEDMKLTNKELYSHSVLEVLCKVQDDLINSKIIDLSIDELISKMILVEDLYCPSGRLMLKSGYELSQEMIMLIKNFKELSNTKLKVINKVGNYYGSV